MFEAVFCYIWYQDKENFLCNFNYFRQFWAFFDISLLQKKLMASVFNRQCQKKISFSYK